jgi:hypothetical protein
MLERANREQQITPAERLGPTGPHASSHARPLATRFLRGSDLTERSALRGDRIN